MRLVIRSATLVAGVLALFLAPAANAQHSPNMHLLASVPAVPDESQPAPHFQSDLAFWGDRAYAGNYDGFRIFDISAPKHPVLLSEARCRGPQNDVSVWQNRLLFLSIDRPQVQPPDQPRGACTTDSPKYPTAKSYPTDQDPDAFEGIRIFDVSDPTNPRFVKGVDTDCGSHTHTLVPDTANNRLLIYVSSYPLRSGPHCGPQAAAAGATTVTGQPVDPLLSTISVVEVPLNAPQNARVIATPPLAQPVFDIADVVPDLAGVFNASRGCHDISVFLELKLAAAACMSNGQVWDISDPAHPKTLPSEGAFYTDRSEVEFWHSATFTWDGRLVIFGDESINGSCNTTDEPDGRLWFYGRTEGTGLTPALGSFLIPRTQDGDYCSAHLFNALPGLNRYVMASAWYNGGSDVIDFTDPANAREVGYWDFPTADEEVFGSSEGVWSTYWYNRFIYANHIEFGFNSLVFSDSLTAGARRLGHFNPQTQETLAQGAPRGKRPSSGRIRLSRSHRARGERINPNLIAP